MLLTHLMRQGGESVIESLGGEAGAMFAFLLERTAERIGTLAPRLPDFQPAALVYLLRAIDEVSVGVHERLADLAGGYAPSGSADMAVWLRRRSVERRRLRLAAFGVDTNDVKVALAGITGMLPDVPSGTMRALVGAFGAGKSEIAEAWHLQTIDDFAASDSVPVPLWLHAREIGTGAVDEIIARQIGAPLLRERGVSAVIDGLDEVDGLAAEGIAVGARVLTAGDARSRVLITTRAGVLPASDDQHAADGLPEAQARSLVAVLAGPHATWDWTPELVETIRRPFFALAAGTLIAAGEAPRGQAELISKLVESALSRAGVATGSIELFGILVKLAVALTRSNGTADELSFVERRQALTTRLVASGPRGGVAFVLPIFEQWFAAEALRTNQYSIGDAASSAATFDRWRWAIAVAALDGPVDRSDDFIAACVRLNPGAGAWLIDQIVDRRSWDAPEEGPIDLEAVSSRLLRAVRAWAGALGPLAGWVLPVQDAESPVRIGTRIVQERVAVGWSKEVPQSDEVAELPVEADWRAHGDEWRQIAWGLGIPSQHWPWKYLRDMIAASTLPMFNRGHLLGSSGGVWHAERSYLTARVMANTSAIRRPPLARDFVVELAEARLKQAEGSVRAGWQTSAGVVDSLQIKDLVAWLVQQEVDEVVHPLPAPDIESPETNWVTGLYSHVRLAQFCAEMLGCASAVYEDLCRTLFSKFTWSLVLYASGPFGVIGELYYDEGFTEYGEPGFEYVVVPLPVLEKYASERSGWVWSENGRSAIRVAFERDSSESRLRSLGEIRADVSDWIRRSGSASPFATFGLSVSTVIECAHDRPASLTAAGWLCSDLRALGLLRGGVPQLPSR
ncbi:hypothetical protein GCM10009745_80380 [Kribbella yunnanensis]|uniref:ATP-binding protein n=1 Tax=Kribbella yunnanensis TaxID=190194 RepID=A0ABP4VCL8_9ACTN